MKKKNQISSKPVNKRKSDQDKQRTKKNIKTEDDDDFICDNDLSSDDNLSHKQSKSSQYKSNKPKLSTIIEPQQNQISNDDIVKDFPSFLKPQNIKDSNERPPSHPDYDKTTLYISPKDMKSQAQTLQQYWKVKCQCFDHIVAFKLGKFYHTFFDDAIIVSRLSDVKLKFSGWIRGAQCSFYENQLQKIQQIIVDDGHRFTVIDQQEHFEQKANEEDCIKRGVSYKVSRGTQLENTSQEYWPQILLCILETKTDSNIEFGFVLADVSTRDFYIGCISDDDHLQNLRDLCYRHRPIEVVFKKKYLTTQSLNLLKGIPSKPSFTSFEGNDNSDEQLKFCFQNQLIPEFIQSLLEIQDIKRQALIFMYSYLSSMMLDESIFQFGNFQEYNHDNLQFMHLDSQTLSNLEIIECNVKSNILKTQSLFENIDHTCSPMGKRLLYKWIISPLRDVNKIVQRREAVDDLIKNVDISDHFQNRIKKLPDIERTMNRICSMPKERMLAKWGTIDIGLSKLQQFMDFLKQIKEVDDIIDSFDHYINRFKSSRLRNLCSFYDINETSKKGMFPKLKLLIENIENQVYYRNNIPTPQKGSDQEYDAIVEQINSIKDELQKYLDLQKKILKNNSIIYVNSKNKYEIEVEENSKVPDDYSLSSKRKGYLRYHTPFIEQQIYKLQMLEHECQDKIVPFICKYFQRFMEKKIYWQQMCNCLAEIDCLASLAVYARKLKIKCKPEFVSSNISTFKLEGMVHPCVEQTGIDFVPNDTVFSEKTFALLVTGPNMGGKSTLLRQSCIAIIMAQIGCYVPCKNFQLSPVDRIFTRIGAQDRILEGKSTFFIEMEETKVNFSDNKNFVSNATKNSFAIIDELGRGTSTYDGLALAYGVLKYCIEKIQCFLLFSTHYHQLVQEFKDCQNLENFHMSFLEKKDEIIFLYKFKPGTVPQSFGLNVARMAGIFPEVIQSAKIKSQQFVEEKNNNSLVNKNFYPAMDFIFKK